MRWEQCSRSLSLSRREALASGKRHKQTERAARCKARVSRAARSLEVSLPESSHKKAGRAPD